MWLRCFHPAARPTLISNNQPPTRTIGIDFDNTIVDYDDVFVRYARDMNLVPATFAGNKSLVRTTLQALPQGNVKWTQLQAVVYGTGIRRAVPFAGFRAFLDRCVAAGARVCIVSHKTRFAAAGGAPVDLRRAAFDWLSDQGFLTKSARPLGADSIYFEDDRAAKIRRIAACGCTHFIDDLSEVLEDPAFPLAVERYHFIGSRGTQAGGLVSWTQISHAIFG